MFSVRPKIRVGDVVKLSKKGKSFPRKFPLNSTLVVSYIEGDGIDRSTLVRCRVINDGSFETHIFYRSELWFAGKNVFK